MVILLYIRKVPNFYPKQLPPCVQSGKPSQDCTRGPHDLCFLARGRGGWVVCETMNPSPSTYRQYIDFNRVFPYKAGT